MSTIPPCPMDILVCGFAPTTESRHFHQEREKELVVCEKSICSRSSKLSFFAVKRISHNNHIN